MSAVHGKKYTDMTHILIPTHVLDAPEDVMAVVAVHALDVVIRAARVVAEDVHQAAVVHVLKVVLVTA